MSDDLSEERDFVFNRVSQELAKHGFQEAKRMGGPDGTWTMAFAHGLGTVNVLQSDRELRMNPTVKQLAGLAAHKVSRVLRGMESAA